MLILWFLLSFDGFSYLVQSLGQYIRSKLKVKHYTINGLHSDFLQRCIFSSFILKPVKICLPSCLIHNLHLNSEESYLQVVQISQSWLITSLATLVVYMASYFDVFVYNVCKSFQQNCSKANLTGFKLTTVENSVVECLWWKILETVDSRY